MEVILPWEHYVCSECYQENPYAIWLVKQRCFKPHRHRQTDQTLVIVDKESTAMVQIRPLPGHYDQFRGEFALCHHFIRRACRYGSMCRFAHLKIEKDTWNIKKRMLKGNDDLQRLQNIIAAGIQRHFPSEVCVICCERYNNAIWLAWLLCVHPEEHMSSERCNTVVDKASVVRVRELPSRIRHRTDPNTPKLCQSVRNSQGCPQGDTCCFAHSMGELNYWKWCLANNILDGLHEEFQALCHEYVYPTEASIQGSVEEVTRLAPQNYQEQYHKLVYLDELAHSRKMIQECNGTVGVEVPREQDRLLRLTGLNSGAIDYAIHGHAVVHLSVGSHTYTAAIEGRDDRTDTLLVHVHDRSFSHAFRGQRVTSVSAHFEINHYYFRRLHEAIQNASHIVVKKLLPKSESFPFDARGHNRTRSRARYARSIGNFTLDREYQTHALERMLSSDSNAPFLLLGPFGTGKTHLIAAAVVKLLDSSVNNKVLVCTHQNVGADNVFGNLQRYAPRVHQKALRLVPSEKTVKGMPLSNSCKTLKQVSRSVLNKYRVIITTFLTALSVKEMCGLDQLSFTHILIDEGAQSREPEALGAVVLANESTKLIIVGDNQQIGPQVAVLSDAARKNGLGTPLIERLYKRYQFIRGARRSHTTTLLTNYRSHPSILMLASSLFYQCTLLSRSTSEAHPKAPYPILFACTSLDSDEEHFRNLPAENEKEAELLVTRMLEFVREWPVEADQSKPTVGLLASTRKQVTLLRQKFNRRVQNRATLPCIVDIKPTYIIQGEEFTAVFLSTCEPTDGTGQARDPVRSICNEQVFNTLITRARSLIFTAGNPFLLHHMGKSCDVNCWAEYVQRCIQCQTLHLPEPKSESEVQQLPRKMKEIFRKVFYSDVLDEATQLSIEEKDINAIVERYIKDLHNRKEFRIAHRLVQDPRGNMRWEEADPDDKQNDSDDIEWCVLDCKSYHTATAVPLDSSKSPIEIEGIADRRLALHRDRVKVDMKNKCVLLDDQTEKAVCETHFGTSFLCQVDPKNPIMFFPLDKRNPKFVNLPTLTRQESNGVVCFDPQSLNDTPKMNNFIPVECAVKMLFIVKFLGWRKRFPYPLGIIVGALPRGNSPITGDMVLRIAHNVPLTPERVFTNCNVPVQPPQTPSRILFPDAFTIDPEGSTDHDDALTCEILKREVDSEEYRIGVHITNVQKYVPKGSDIDDIAAKRGCAVYSDPTNCICKMLPESIVDDTSLLQDKQRAAFSVLARVILKNGTADSIHSVTITESGITSKLELSYPEAQSLINNGHPRIEPTLTGKTVRYNSSRGPGALTIETQLQILWKVASFLRYQRLGKGAYCFPINEPGEDQHPEAHYLVEELMIWANTNVAKKLLETFPDSTVIRTQARPNERQLQSFIEDHGPRMATSFSLRRYAPQEQPQCESVQILKTTLNGIQHAVRTGNIKKALHFVQFEHLHPQLAVAHNCFRQVQSPSNYQVSVRGEENYRHDTLRCNSYTHFTSPIRRFIDIAIQRMLHAALNGQKNPYAREELEDICTLSKEAAKRANDYEREMKRLRLAGNLQQNSREFTCFVTMIEEGKLFICYPDLSLQKCHSRDIIHLKNLNATSIPQQNETEPVGASVVSEATTVPRPASWRAKVSSLSGSLQPFLANRHLQLCPKVVTAQQKAEMSIFVPERGDEADSDSQLVEKKLLASVLPFTHTVPLESWSKVQDQLEKKNSEILSPERLLQLFSPGGSTEPPQVTSLTPFLRAKSPLWIYTVNRLLQPCEVMQVQLCASSIQGHRESASLTPRVQLLEVAPNLRICIQHNSNPVECFIDRPTHIASRKEYNDLRVYWTEWEKVLLAEAAYNSLTDSELLLVRDVTLTWPKLAKQIDSSGQVYYRLPVQNGTCAYVEMELPKSFMKSSYEFFQFTQGDLVCVRYDANDTKCVFHMIVHEVVEPKELRKSDEVSKATVYLKFVSQSANYISHKMEKSLSASGDRTPHCEVQLIPLTLPYRRIYRSLRALQRDSTALAESIALGKARIRSTNSCNVGTMLSQEDMSIATSLWPLQSRSDGKERLELNQFQREAIDNAFSSGFSMVQGPPGTGKSVTGAHLAFALAMMLHKRAPRVTEGRNAKDRRPSPCVLYCGPSQHSVDVVLDMLTSHNSPVKKTTLKIIRIYSKEIEKSDFAGLKQYSEVFRKKRTDVKCEAKYREYALHHLVHEKDPTILTMERDFERYYHEGKIPSCKERKAHRSAVYAAEKAVLMDGIDIVLCTCNEASSRRVMEGIKPVYCIVDECAMATEPECMVPIRRAEHVVLIGDHMQLQPVIKYKDAADMGLGVSLFERYVKMNVQPHMLQVQYRMHPSICEFPSVEFYEGKLTTDEQVAKKRRDKAASLRRFWPQWEKPFVFCDIIGTEKEEHTGQKGKARVGLESKYNEKEARQIVHIAKNLIEVHRVSPGEIAVLTPYSAQKAEIRKHMERQAINGVEVKTITDSQGSEYGIVLLSTVRSRKLDDIRTSEGEKKKADIGWIRANLGFITDKHRICVGITRCKYGLVIVGNKVLLSYDSTWNRLIEHYHRNRCIKKGSEFPATQ